MIKRKKKDVEKDRDSALQFSIRFAQVFLSQYVKFLPLSEEGRGHPHLKVSRENN